MRYQVETVDEVFDEIKYLATLSHRELGLEDMFGHIALHKASYKELEEKKALLIVSVREEKSNELVGYAIYFIAQSIFNKKKQAESHSFFIKKEERKGFNALLLFSFAEEQLAKRNVEIVLQKINTSRDISRFFERMKYTQIEKVFVKEL